jgi:transcriptional regulator with XRE-family HTH domain
MQLREWVIAERKRRGWEPKDLADAAELALSVVTRFESGERLGRADTVARLVLALDLPAEHAAALVAQVGRPAFGVANSAGARYASDEPEVWDDEG